MPPKAGRPRPKGGKKWQELVAQENEPITIRRREANSGKVSYSDPVVLHETSRTRLVLVPFFIPRSEGTDLSIKLITYRKANPPENWFEIEHKSLSLQETAARQLLKGLQEHLAVAEESSDGNYILIKVSDGTAQIGSHDPKAVAEALTKVLSQAEIVEHLKNTELSDEFIKAFRYTIRLKEIRAAIAQLRVNLDTGIIDERVYQDWCEKHSWAFGNAYVMRDCVREISPGDHLDMLLPSVIAGYRDIVELKRPDVNVLNFDDSHNNFYFSAESSKAIGQCHRYLDVLQEVAANGLRDHPEIVAYHPRAIIVLGRSNSWDDSKQRALHGLNRRLNGITVMTYDHLLAQGERLISLLTEDPTQLESEAFQIGNTVFDDNDIF